MSFDNTYTGTNDFIDFSQFDANLRISTMTGSVERIMSLDITGNIKDSGVDISKIVKSTSGIGVTGGKAYANIVGFASANISVPTGLSSVSSFVVTPLASSGLLVVSTYSIPDSSSSTQIISTAGIALGTNQYGFAWQASGSL